MTCSRMVEWRGFLVDITVLYDISVRQKANTQQIQVNLRLNITLETNILKLEPDLLHLLFFLR